MSTATPNVTDPSVETADAPEITCPKCNTTTPWKESSWCPDCGYYPGITDAVPEEAKPADAPVVEEAETPAEKPLLPKWVTWSIGGATTIVVASIGASYYFTYWGGDRSLVSLIVLLSGIAAFLGAHILTSVASMQESGDVAPFDIIGRPIEMWRPTIHGLPKTGNRIVSGVCGMAAILSALVIIGGLDFNSIFEKEEVVDSRPGVFKRIVTTAADAAPEEDQPETIEDALDAIQPDVEELDAASSALLPQPGEPLQCVVYGYMNDGKEGIGRLLLAAEVHGTRVHVATLDFKKLPPHIRASMNSRLANLTAENSSVDTRYNGTWVKPSVAFNVDFTGWSMAGELIRPRLSVTSTSD